MGEPRAVLWSATVVAHEAARALGEQRWVVQVRAFGLARSRADFARRLIAAGLASGSETSVSRYLRDYGSACGSDEEERVAAQHPDKVFVRPLTAAAGRPMIAWPPAPEEADRG